MKNRYSYSIEIVQHNQNLIEIGVEGCYYIFPGSLGLEDSIYEAVKQYDDESEEEIDPNEEKKDNRYQQWKETRRY